MNNLRTAAQAVLDSLDSQDSAVERLRLARHVARLREELSKPDDGPEWPRWSILEETAQRQLPSGYAVLKFRD